MSWAPDLITDELIKENTRPRNISQAKFLSAIPISSIFED